MMRGVVGGLVMALTVALSSGLAGCAPINPYAGRRTVVASFYPLAYVARRIVDGHATVIDLTRPGVEPEDLELDVAQTAEIADAEVAVYESGFQPAVDQAIAQTGPDHLVDTTATVPIRDANPHFWLDPVLLARVARTFTATMVIADPAHAADYRQNLRGLERDLHRLDRAFETGLRTCRLHTAVTTHAAFGYLGHRYGLHFVSINGLSPDAEPSPEHLRRLQQLIRQQHLTTVFSEALASPVLARTLAADLGLRTGVLNTLEGLTPATSNQTYLSLMRRNLAALKKANGCR
ncbi:MAG TPA: metal ABC transporter substrate-binding protein [Nocardioidaceae bacterium]|nr:metal ABC transporter substrate-binding protein [Nocardioidaceae bacterium]